MAMKKMKQYNKARFKILIWKTVKDLKMRQHGPGNTDSYYTSAEKKDFKLDITYSYKKVSIFHELDGKEYLAKTALSNIK